MANQTILTSGGATWLRSMLLAQSQAEMPPPCAYVVLSSGTTQVSQYMTTLPGEVFRKPITSRASLDYGVSYATLFLTTEAPNQTIRAYGLIAGSGAASELNGGGVLVAVAAEDSPFTKTPAMSLTVEMTLTLSGMVA